MCNERNEEDDAHLFFKRVKAQAIWNRRQLLSNVPTCNNATNFANCFFHFFDSLTESQQHISATPVPVSQQQCWMKPMAGTLKCNIDAAIFEQDNTYGVGLCIQHENGVFVKGKTMWFDGIPEPPRG